VSLAFTHTPDRHAQFAAAYPRLRRVTADQLVSLQVHGVTPARLREYTQLGYGNLDCNRSSNGPSMG
jgi:hypothetical protein